MASESNPPCDNEAIAPNQAYDDEAIALFVPWLEELMSDVSLEPQPQLTLLQQLVELAQELDDVCGRLSSRPLTASQMRNLAGIELLSGSLAAKIDDFVNLFQD